MSESNELVESNFLVDIINAAVKAKSDAARRYAEQKEKDNPTLSRSQMADIAITEDSIWAGLVGIGTGSINAIPGLGQVIQLGIIAPEVAYLFYLQTTLVVYLCKIYDKELEEEQIRILVLASLGGAAGVEIIKEAITKAAINASRKVIMNVLKGTVLKTLKDILKAVGIRFTRKGLLSKLPFISIAINPVMNYADIKLIGITAKNYLEEIYGKCSNCGHKMPEVGKFCSMCGHRFEYSS
ncbi:MAG: hypothetical protein QG628_421 [Patescibacteria group bacterium]|nr:hypothetical protein [Patescibacteria group bacterium]MDQ5951343.1 hypothetical protein [Patescibacteria group bacterium]